MATLLQADSFGKLLLILILLRLVRSLTIRYKDVLIHSTTYGASIEMGTFRRLREAAE